MLDAPVDAWYVWVGLAVVSTVAFGAVAGLPTAPPPGAGAAAVAVDRVAAADHDASDRHRVAADAAKVSPHAIALRDDGRTARARLRYGPVVPVPRDGPLRAVLRSVSPGRHFDSPAALERAAEVARDRPARWRRTDRLLVRTVTWGEVSVTLVGG